MLKIHFKNSPKVWCKGGLQVIEFALKYTCIKRRKCVHMIQPISYLTTQVGHRGSKGSYGKMQGNTSAGAVVNAIGLSLTAGGITAATSRIYTRSWAQASMLGLCGMFLTMFFMTPQLIEKFGIKKEAVALAEKGALKGESAKAVEVVKQVKPANVKKLVPFRQQS